jgi:hypothetical protein
MATFDAPLRRYSGGAGAWYPRKVTRRDDKVPFEIYHPHNAIVGTVWINKASIVGCGTGTGVTITDASSKIVLTE